MSRRVFNEPDSPHAAAEAIGEGVSVVIPCYNAAKYLRETLDSVLAQDYRGPLEVLVADDGSTDGSAEIIKSYGPPVRLLRKPPDNQRSSSSARNRCLEAASQPFVAFLDADDLWLPGHLRSLAGAFAERPDLGLAYNLSYIAAEDGRVHKPWDDRSQPETLTPDELLLASRFGTGSVMVRRSVVVEVGGFDEELRYSEDHDLWLRIVERYPAACVPVYGFKYRRHTHQQTRDPAIWTYAARMLEKARRRYPYRRRAVRRRRAVIAYRQSQIARHQRRWLEATCLLAKSALLDPLRAGKELSHRCLTRKA